MNWYRFIVGIYKIWQAWEQRLIHTTGKWNKDMMAVAFTTTSCMSQMDDGICPLFLWGVWAPTTSQCVWGRWPESGLSWNFCLSPMQSLSTWFMPGFIKCFHCGPFKLLRVPLYGVNQWWKATTKSTGMDTANNVGMQEENKHSREKLDWERSVALLL